MTDLRPTRTTPNSRAPRLSAFWIALATVCAAYVLLLLAMLAADAMFALLPGGQADAANGPGPLSAALADPNIRHSLHLTLVSCTISSLLSLMVATPIGYLLSRGSFPGKRLVDAVMDIPIVLPPLVVGLSLLVLMQWFPPPLRDAVVYQTPAVILAQFVVASAFAIRVMRGAFDQTDHRQEEVARSLGASRAQAFGWVVLPQVRGAMLTAGLLAWARAMGEFGPLLVFAGATRGKTEVLSTTVFLELSVGNLRGAVAVSLLMIAASVLMLTLARLVGDRAA